MKIRSRIYKLQLKHTFGISRSSRDFQKTLIIELEQGGLKGYGEVTESAYYNANLVQMQVRLNQLKPVITDYELTDPELFWDFLHHELEYERFLHCGIDVAAHDLFGKMTGKPLFKTWGLEWKNIPLTNYTIGIDTIAKMKQKLIEKPWPVYKIKLGTKQDLEIIQALRSISDAVFRIDANAGWTVEQTIQMSNDLKALQVELIEQPLDPNAWDEMVKVKNESALPVFADESCKTEKDLENCAGCFDGVNVKLMKAGGLTPGRRMLIQAKNMGLKTMVGCMTESSVGISAITHLLPYLDYVDMDGALLLKNDLATGPKISNGKIEEPENPGTGAILLSAWA